MTPCWIWTGSLNAKGYGRCFGGMAHRRYYEEYIGPVPEGRTIDHLCRVRNCVNPEHLEAVSHAENCRRGAAACPVTTTSEFGEWLRSERQARALSQSDLAGILGVSPSLIGFYETGKGEPPPDRLADIRRVLGERDLAEGNVGALA
jgi:DNA-binding transcriptional regulator YiaG